MHQLMMNNGKNKTLVIFTMLSRCCYQTVWYNISEQKEPAGCLNAAGTLTQGQPRRFPLTPFDFTLTLVHTQDNTKSAQCKQICI